MKLPQIIVVAISLISVAIAVWLRPDRPADVQPPIEIPPAAATGQPMPPSLQQPGVTSRLVGLLRAYVAVPEEVRLEPFPEDPRVRVTRIPLLVMLENETYGTMTSAAAGFTGSTLCTVRVTRLQDDGAAREVFHTDVSLPERTIWLSAERRSFVVDWPLPEDSAATAAGDYKVSVDLALHDEPAVEIYTRLR